MSIKLRASPCVVVCVAVLRRPGLRESCGHCGRCRVCPFSPKLGKACGLAGLKRRGSQVAVSGVCRHVGCGNPVRRLRLRMHAVGRLRQPIIPRLPVHVGWSLRSRHRRGRRRILHGTRATESKTAGDCTGKLQELVARPFPLLNGGNYAFCSQLCTHRVGQAALIAGFESRPRVGCCLRIGCLQLCFLVSGRPHEGQDVFGLEPKHACVRLSAAKDAKHGTAILLMDS